MSIRICYSIVKGVPPDRARALIAKASTAFPGPRPKNSQWSDWTHVVKPKQMVALACSDGLIIADDAWRLAEEIARLVAAPHLELRVQEGDHWDLTLRHRGDVVADFSTRVAYFDANPDAPRPWKQGDAGVFARCWGVPLELVSPYLIDWDSQDTPAFAVDGDEFPAGDWSQIFDFMRAIGVSDPYDNPNRFSFDVPWWEGAYIIQPLWRRAIRRVSVWVKGTYPDVPRHTPEERERWRRLRESVQIVKVDLGRPQDEEQRLS